MPEHGNPEDCHGSLWCDTSVRTGTLEGSESERDPGPVGKRERRKTEECDALKWQAVAGNSSRRSSFFQPCQGV